MDWIFGLIAVVAFLVGCVFGYDIGHMKGCEKFLKDQKDIEKMWENYTPIIHAESFEVVPIYTQTRIRREDLFAMSGRGEIMINRELTQDIFRQVEKYIETTATEDAPSGDRIVMKKVNLAVRR